MMEALSSEQMNAMQGVCLYLLAAVDCVQNETLFYKINFYFQSDSPIGAFCIQYTVHISFICCFFSHFHANNGRTMILLERTDILCSVEMMNSFDQCLASYLTNVAN